MKPIAPARGHVVKVGVLNLPASFVQGRRFAYGIARDDQVKVALASTPDAVAVWALLQPLFATLLAPIKLRSQSAGTIPADEAKKTWAGVEKTLADLGLDVAEELAVLRYGSGWSRLKAEEQRRAKVEFVARLAPQVGIDHEAVPSHAGLRVGGSLLRQGDADGPDAAPGRHPPSGADPRRPLRR